MRVILSFYNSDQYENDRDGISFPLQMTENQFGFLKSIFESYLDDTSALHVRLHNDLGHDIFVCLQKEKWCSRFCGDTPLPARGKASCFRRAFRAMTTGRSQAQSNISA